MTNEYIVRHENIILIGATGSGKTYIANALGVNACFGDYKVRYIRLPELFDEYHHAVIQDKREECLRKIQKFHDYYGGKTPAFRIDGNRQSVGKDTDRNLFTA